MKKIIVIEDDFSILSGLEYALQKEDYQVETYQEGQAGYAGIQKHIKNKKSTLGLIILDIMLPKKNGYEICQDLRKADIQIPIIMLTAKSQEQDVIKGLQAGADDYVTKPFSLKELLARVSALLRRVEIEKNGKTMSVVQLNKNCLINCAQHVIEKNGEIIDLPEKENQLLAYFVKNPNKVISREELLEKVWHYADELNFPTTRTVDNYIVKLRQMLEQDPNHPKYLKTVYRAGYKFELNS